MAAGEQSDLQEEQFSTLRHDIRNQLSNIQLALSGLEFECDSINDDIALYISSIAQSAKKIDKLLEDFKQA